MMPLISLVLATALLCGLLTGVVRRYSLQRAVLDIPNERSFHSVPTPRGGGLAIVIALLFSLGLAGWVGWLSSEMLLAMVPGGILVAVIGWIDDHRPVSAAQRLLAHFAAAAWAVFVAGGLPVLQLGTLSLSVGVAGSAFAVLTIVWLTNLYNFMDGIDGIAATEAITVGLAAAALAAMGGNFGVAVAALLIAAAAAGFLGWNWQPARIFMGDVGSGFLGYVLGVTAVLSEVQGGPPLLLWGVLLGVFVVDATLTLLRRAMRGEQVSAAHRTHAYQRAVQYGMSHRRVAVLTAMLNLLLFGLAALAWMKPAYTALAVLLACSLLLAAYLIVERRRPMFPAPRAAEQTG